MDVRSEFASAGEVDCVVYTERDEVRVRSGVDESRKWWFGGSV